MGMASLKMRITGLMDFVEKFLGSQKQFKENNANKEASQDTNEKKYLNHTSLKKLIELRTKFDQTAAQLAINLQNAVPDKQILAQIQDLGLFYCFY